MALGFWLRDSRSSPDCCCNWGLSEGRTVPEDLLLSRLSWR